MKLILFLALALPMILSSQEPNKYVCNRSTEAIIVDGANNESAWENSLWTDCFVDIEGDKKPVPYYSTRVKMLWDDSCIYFFAEIEDPHIWATLTKRESVIFYDNNFEIFIDPDGDCHNYTELEINAFGTEWDLLLVKPYRNEGAAINAYNIKGLKSAVKISGTINYPGDKDEKWTVEIAMPWISLLETNSQSKRKPQHGEIWRINFSRVQWETEIIDSVYKKKRNLETGRLFPEHNWTWSPHGRIDMHMPEKWGYVKFSDSLKTNFSQSGFVIEDAETINVLWDLYRKQKHYYMTNNSYTTDLPHSENTEIFVGKHQFEIVISVPETNRSYYLNQDGLFKKFVKEKQ